MHHPVPMPPHTGVGIRRLAAHDRPAWQALYTGYAHFYRVAPDPAALDRTWSWLLSPDHAVQGLVAEASDRTLAGLAHYRACPDPLLGRDLGFLDDLYVAAHWRGQGIGRALIAALAATAREQGWPLLRWVTAEDNAQARRLYERVARRSAWLTYELDIAPRP